MAVECTFNLLEFSIIVFPPVPVTATDFKDVFHRGVEWKKITGHQFSIHNGNVIVETESNF